MKTNNEIINTTQRRKNIIDLLNTKKTVLVNELSKRFKVSTVSIRNDLRQLEAKGCVLRFRGGAMLNKKFAFDLPLIDKNNLNFNIKNKIAKKAAEFVDDGDCIILDSGSTTAAMVPYLKHKKNLTVLTNALNIAYDLAANTDIDVIVTGGNVRKDSYSIFGPYTEKLLKLYNFKKLFLGVDGFDLEAGITTPNFSEATVNKAMCSVSEQIIVVTDSSKFGRKSFCVIEKIDNIKYVVTDSQINSEYSSKLNILEIKLIIADNHL